MWNKDIWRHPTADELDVLLGFPRGFTAVPSVDEETRERMLGNTMHLGCIERILQDFPGTNEAAPSGASVQKTPPEEQPATPPPSGDQCPGASSRSRSR